ncbi:MAG: 2OG-Fe(II) oxygenase [Caulobacteraceae bacterium]|nr:2OG-Fe(II) oxygenase [Caulobacteraceae bacterium]
MAHRAKGPPQSVKSAKPKGVASAAVAAAPPQMRMLQFGEPAPFFIAESDINPRFAFSTTAGRWIVLALLGDAAYQPVQALLQAAFARRGLFNDTDAAFFAVTHTATESLKSGPGFRYFTDADLAVSRQFGATDGTSYRPLVYLLDRALRVVAVDDLLRADRLFDLAERLIAEEAPTLCETSAPVMTIPNIFEPALCDRLIEYYREQGGQTSGFMREVDGKTLLLHDVNHKRRRDVTVEEQGLKDAIRARIERRLLPMIERAYGWNATQMERYLIAQYRDEEAGFFRPHRDNTTSGTAHRKFAVSINLNADYDGGLLRFPEFGQRTYKPPVGGATVFSCSLLHEATPVTRGERFVFVPFLYDERGAKIRAANLHKVQLET